MMNQQPLDIVTQFYAAIASQDYETLFALLSEDITWRVHGPQEIPYAGEYYGHAGVKDFFSAVAATEQLMQFAAHEISCCEDKAFAFGSEKGRVLATEREFVAAWIQIFTVAGAKIRRFEEYIDSAQIYKAII